MKKLKRDQPLGMSALLSLPEESPLPATLSPSKYQDVVYGFVHREICLFTRGNDFVLHFIMRED